MGPRDVFFDDISKTVGFRKFSSKSSFVETFFWFWCSIKKKTFEKIPSPSPQKIFKTSAKIQIAIFPTRQCWLLKICKVSNWSQYLRGLLCHLVLLWFCLFCSFHWNVHCIALSGFYLSLLHHIYNLCLFVMA